MPAVYRLGDSLFVVAAQRRAADCLAEVWRVQAGELARVLDPDGTPFEATAPALWQAQHRAVSRLESFLHARAYEQRDDELPYAPRVGTWQLPA